MRWMLMRWTQTRLNSNWTESPMDLILPGGRGGGGIMRWMQTRLDSNWTESVTCFELHCAGRGEH